MGGFAIDEQAKPIGMRKRRALAGGFEFGEGLGHAGEPELGANIGSVSSSIRPTS
jgi:hypothetical protein